jgi:hypothetical protein
MTPTEREMPVTDTFTYLYNNTVTSNKVSVYLTRTTAGTLNHFILSIRLIPGVYLNLVVGNPTSTAGQLTLNVTCIHKNVPCGCMGVSAAVCFFFFRMGSVSRLGAVLPECGRRRLVPIACHTRHCVTRICLGGCKPQTGR